MFKRKDFFPLCQNNLIGEWKTMKPIKTIEQLLLRVDQLSEESANCKTRYDWKAMYEAISRLSLCDLLISPKTPQLKAIEFLLDVWLDDINKNHL